jgi:hypothetical protein
LVRGLTGILHYADDVDIFSADADDVDIGRPIIIYRDVLYDVFFFVMCILFIVDIGRPIIIYRDVLYDVFFRVFFFGGCILFCIPFSKHSKTYYHIWGLGIKCMLCIHFFVKSVGKSATN